MVGLDRKNVNWNILDDLSSRIWVPNKTEDIDLNDFNILNQKH